MSVPVYCQCFHVYYLLRQINFEKALKSKLSEKVCVENLQGIFLKKS